jgi:Flp pilus assembly protein TadG
MGAAIDFGRWSNASSKTTAALDAALLAAGRQLQTEPGEMQKALDAAQLYFTTLTTQRLTVDNATSQFALADGGMSIEGTATGSIKTPFLSFVAVTALDVKATAKASLAVGGNGGNSDLEISLMLDVTESMCDNGIGPCTAGAKMDAMKYAAKDLVKIVMGANTSTQTARVALVPFSTRVRVDDETSANAAPLMKKLTNLDPTWNGWHNDCQHWSGSGSSTSSESAGTNNWTCDQWVATQVNWKVVPCVTDRTGPDEFTDAPPGANSWLNAHEGGRAPVSWDSSDTPLTTQTGTSKTDPSYNWNYNDAGTCWDITAPNYVMPLSTDETALNQRIDALEAYGSTSGALGTAWAWYLISPNWSSIWPAASTPGPYAELTQTNPGGAPKLRKIAVLMTDGDYNTYREWKDYDPVYVANNAKSICANMKAQGIEIFTVGFELDSLPAAQKARAIDTLQTCGTDIAHFYNSIDPAQLKNAFRDIAMKLATLYIAR